MGSLPLILAGDFRQTLPVIPKGTNAEEIAACLKYSRSLSPKVRTVRLTNNMRVHLYGDRESGSYAQLLLEIGNGTIPTDAEDGLINVPSGTVVQSSNELIQAVFRQIHDRYKEAPGFPNRAKKYEPRLPEHQLKDGLKHVAATSYRLRERSYNLLISALTYLLAAADQILMQGKDPCSLT